MLFEEMELYRTGLRIASHMPHLCMWLF